MESQSKLTTVLVYVLTAICILWGLTIVSASAQDEPDISDDEIQQCQELVNDYFGGYSDELMNLVAESESQPAAMGFSTMQQPAGEPPILTFQQCIGRCWARYSPSTFWVCQLFGIGQSLTSYNCCAGGCSFVFQMRKKVDDLGTYCGTICPAKVTQCLYGAGST